MPMIIKDGEILARSRRGKCICSGREQSPRRVRNCSHVVTQSPDVPFRLRNGWTIIDLMQVNITNRECVFS